MTGVALDRERGPLGPIKQLAQSALSPQGVRNTFIKARSLPSTVDGITAAQGAPGIEPGVPTDSSTQSPPTLAQRAAARRIVRLGQAHRANGQNFPPQRAGSQP